MTTSLALALVAALCPAQDAPLVRIDLSGPAVVRSALRPTSLGSLLASSAAEAIWHDVVAELETRWRDLDGGDRATFAATQARWLAYEGRFHIAVWANQTVALVADRDDHTELAAMAADAERWLSRALGVATRPSEHAGVTLARGEATAAAFAIGTLADGRILLLAGTDADAVSAAVEGAPLAFAKGPAALLEVRVDLAQAYATQVARDRVLGRTGFESVRELTLKLGTRGPRVQVEAALTFAGPRGLFAAFFPEHEGIPALFGLVPKAAVAAKVGRFDATAFYRALLTLGAENGADGVAKFEAKVRDQLGFDPAKDLLPHLTDELVVFWQTAEKLDADASALVNLRVFLAMRLRDGKAFAKSFRLLMEKFGMRPVDEDGVLRSGDWWLSHWGHVAVSKDLFVLALSPDDLSGMWAVLAKKQPWDGMPEDVRELLAAAPPGCNGAGVLDVRTVARDHVELFTELLSPLSLDLPSLPPALRPRIDWDELAGLLGEHHLDRVITLSGTADQRWAFRVFW